MINMSLLSFYVFLTFCILPELQGFLVSSKSCRWYSVATTNDHRQQIVQRRMPLAIFRHKSAGKPDNVQIESHADWMELHEDFNTELPGKQKMIIAVTFHASWCKFCKKFNLKWNRKLVRPLKDTVKFASVEFGINQKLCKSLNVKQLPTVQFYCDGELLSSFPCVPKGFSKIQKTLQTYLEMDSAALKQQSKIWAACAKAKCETARQITAPATINNDKVDDGNKSIDTETLHLRRRKRVKRN